MPKHVREPPRGAPSGPLEAEPELGRLGSPRPWDASVQASKQAPGGSPSPERVEHGVLCAPGGPGAAGRQPADPRGDLLMLTALAAIGLALVVLVLALGVVPLLICKLFDRFGPHE